MAIGLGSRRKQRQSFAVEQLKTSLAAIDTAFSIDEPSPASLSLLFTAAETSGETAQTSGDARARSAQALWDLITSPVFASLASGSLDERHDDGERDGSASKGDDLQVQAIARVVAQAAAIARETETVPETEPEPVPETVHGVAHLVLLSKVVAGLRAAAIAQLVRAAAPVAADLAYFSELPHSRTAAVVYALQTAPVHLDRGLSASLLAALSATSAIKLVPSHLIRILESRAAVQQPQQPQQPQQQSQQSQPPFTSAAPTAASNPSAQEGISFKTLMRKASKGVLVPLHQIGLNFALRLRSLSWLDVARADAAQNRAHLEHVQLLQAQCLGMLARSNSDGPFHIPANPVSLRATQSASVSSRKLTSLVRNLSTKHRRGPTVAKRIRKSMQSLAAGENSHSVQKEVSELLTINITTEIASLRAVSNTLAKLNHDEDVDVDEELWLVADSMGETNVPIQQLYEDVRLLTLSLTNISRETDLVLQQYGRPSFILRAWLPTAGLLFGGLLLFSYTTPVGIARFVYNSFTQISETLRDFATNWIMNPIKNVLQTIRHDEARLAMMGTESLSSDLDSLERMVIDFARDNGTIESAAAIRDRVRLGDLTMVLQRYEQDIKHPFRSAIAGDLIRSLLIQIQKAKVDSELAISALDKLLKSNELNFAFLAVMPTLAITYIACGWIYRALMPRPTSSWQLVASIKRSLRDVERIFNNMTPTLHNADSSDNSQPAIALGLLLCELCYLRECGASLPSSAVDKMRLQQDFSDLETVAVYHGADAPHAGIAILERIWRTHAFLQN